MTFPRTTSKRRGKRKRKPPLFGSTHKRVKRPSWKLVGLAGVAGVAATGVVVARNRRAHRELPPDELRESLHRRLAEVAPEPGTRAPAPPA